MQNPASSLEEIERMVREKEEKAKLESPDLTLDALKQVWGKYAFEQDSQHVQLILKNARLELENGVITAKVGTHTALHEIKKETNLITRLREYFRRPRLQIRVLFEPSLAPPEVPKPKQLYTAKEKYDHLVKKNPLLKTMKDSFGLKPEED